MLYYIHECVLDDGKKCSPIQHQTFASAHLQLLEGKQFDLADMD
jgi:hypothetical protein